MTIERYSELRVPEALETFPEALRRLLLSLSRTLQEADPYDSAGRLQKVLEYLLRYYTGAATGLLLRLEPERPEVDALAHSADSLIQFERLLRFSLDALEEYSHHPIAVKLRKVFFLNGKQNLPFSHTRWLRLAGQPDNSLPPLSTWTPMLEKIRANDDEAACQQDIKRFLEMLRTWLEGSEPFFAHWQHHYLARSFPGGPNLRLVCENFEFDLLPKLPPEFLSDDPSPAVTDDEPEPEIQLPDALSIDADEDNEPEEDDSPTPPTRTEASVAVPRSIPLETQPRDRDREEPDEAEDEHAEQESGEGRPWEKTLPLEPLSPQGPIIEPAALTPRSELALKPPTDAEGREAKKELLELATPPAPTPKPEAIRLDEPSSLPMLEEEDPPLVEFLDEAGILPEEDPDEALQEKLVFLAEEHGNEPPDLFEELGAVIDGSPESHPLQMVEPVVNPYSPWSREEIEAFEALLLKTYPPVAPELIPHGAIDGIHRFLNSQVRGYILVEGEQGTGKSLLCQALAPVIQSSRQGPIPVLYFPIRARLQTDCQTFIEQLNEHLRVRPTVGRRSFEALDHHVIKHLNIRFPAQARAARMAAYLSELFLINETPFLLMLDGLDEAFEGAGGQATLSDYLPEQLPDGVYLLATYRPIGLSGRANAKLDVLKQASSMVLRLDPRVREYQQAAEQHLLDCAPEDGWTEEELSQLREKSEGRIAMARHLADLMKSGLLPEEAEIPDSDRYFEVTLKALEHRFGQRFLNLFLLLATSDEPVPASEFSIFGVRREDGVELVHNLPSFFHCFDRENPGLTFAHRSLKFHLQENYYTLYAEICQILGRFALRQLEELPDPVTEARLRLDRMSLTLRRLYSWALDSQSHELLAEVCTSQALRKTRTAVFSELEDKGLFHRKTTILDGFRQSLAALVERYGRSDFREELAWAHSSRGLAYLHLGHFDRALGDIEHAIHHFIHLVEEEGQHQLRNGLAAAYNRRSEACRHLGQLSSALSDANQAVNQYTLVVEEQQRDELRTLLALAIHNRGQIHRARREFEAALKDLDGSVNMYSRLVELDQKRRLRKHLAQAHHSRACLLLDMNEPEAAVREATSAIDLLEQLVHQEDYENLRNDLASVYNDRAAAYHRLEMLQEAEKDYASAVNIRTYLVSEGRLDVRTDLARTYTNRGLALVGEQEWEPAGDCYDRAIEIFDRLVDTEMREDLYSLRAFARVCRGTLRRQLERLPGALEDYEAAAGDYRLAVVSGEDECLQDLGLALNNLAQIHIARRDYPAALRSSSRAIEIYETELPEDLREVHRHDLAVALQNRADAFRCNGQHTQAFDEYERAIEIYSTLVEQDGRLDLASALAICHLRLGATALEVKDAPETIKDTSRALSLFSNIEPGVGEAFTLMQGQAQATALRSRAYVEVGSPEAALDDATRAIELYRELTENSPSPPELYQLSETLARRGRLMAQLNDPEQAVEDFEESLELLHRLEEHLDAGEAVRRRAEILLDRAQAQLDSGNAGPAVRDVITAFGSGRLVSDSEKMGCVRRVVKALKLDALAALRGEELREAVSRYDLLVELLSALGIQNQQDFKLELAHSLHYRGWAKTRLRELESALDDFDEALEIYADLGEALEPGEATDMVARTHTSRAATLESMGFEEAAFEAYDEAVKIFRHNNTSQAALLATTLASRGRLARKTGEIGRALEDLEQATILFVENDQRPHAAPLLEERAELLSGLGRVRDAVLDLDKAIETRRRLSGDQANQVALIRSLVKRSELSDPEDARGLETLSQVMKYLASALEGGLPAELIDLAPSFLEQVGERLGAEPTELESLLSGAEELAVSLLQAELDRYFPLPDLFLKMAAKLPPEQKPRKPGLLVLASAFCDLEVKKFGSRSLPRLVRCLLLTGRALGESDPPDYLEVIAPAFETVARQLAQAQPSQELEVELNNAARLWQSLPASLVARAGVSRTTLSKIRRW